MKTETQSMSQTPAQSSLIEKSILDSALEITHDFFYSVESHNLYIHGLNYLPAYLNVVHHTYVLKDESEEGRHNLKTSLLAVAGNSFLALYSIFSLIIFALRNVGRKKIVVWTGDIFSDRDNGDFRLGNLYSLLRQEKIPFIEFIRSSPNGLKHTLRNMWKRKRLAVHYSSFEWFALRLTRLMPNRFVQFKGDKPRFVAIAKSLNPYFKVFPTMTYVMKFLLKFLNIQTVVCWDYGNRQAYLIYASKLSGIPLIGFMHGIAHETFMPNQLMTPLEEKDRAVLGLDVMGAWSDWWKAHFEKNSKIYRKLEVSGPMRPVKSQKTKSNRPIKRVLIISEPNSDVEYYMQYVQALLKIPGLEFIIKTRPYTVDVCYNYLIKHMPEISTMPIAHDDILEAIRDVDLVVGSHSTAVLQSSLHATPFLIFNTPKWRDYYKLICDEAAEIFFVRSPEEIQSRIELLSQVDTTENLKKVALRYFGNQSSNGAAWILEKVKANLR